MNGLMLCWGMRRYLDRRSVWMGFRNELGFRFAFAGTHDIFGESTTVMKMTIILNQSE
jgi:hypothetical protein